MNDRVRNVFKGKVLQLNLERVTLPNGQTTELEIAHHPGGAVIVALDCGQSRLPVAAVPPRDGRLDHRIARRQARRQ